MAGNDLKMKVDLTFSASDVPSYDLLSPSDPCCYLFRTNIDTAGRRTYHKVGRTEPLLDNANPKWTNKIRVDYEFERVQHFRIMVYDIDDPKIVDDLTKQEVIGYVDITLGQLMSSPNSSLKLEVFKEDSLSEKHKKMRLTIHAIEVIDSRQWLTGEIRGLDLKKHGFFSQDDTSLEFCKHRADGTTNVFYQSAVIPKNNKDPRYAGINVGLGSIFQGVDDLSTTMTIRIVRVRRNEYKSRVVIGEVTKQVSDFIKSTTDPQLLFELKDGSKTTGKIEIVFAKVESLPTFLDYVRAGLTFRLFVHVDGTASNVTATQNLHALSSSLNQYQKAIRSCGDVLAAYTRSSNIHASGYGASVSIDNGPRETNFCFPLTLNTQRWHVRDVDELLYSYQYFIKNAALSGPTNFTPGIKHVLDYCNEPYSPVFQHFNILLILTDGLISDMSKTIDTIVQASGKPLSIVIVGVGDADFGPMNVLDGDDSRLTSPTFGAAVNDIVQFVPFREFAQNDISAIAAATLAEIPDQVISFFRLHKIKPLDIPQFNRMSTSGAPGDGYEYQPPTSSPPA